MKNFLSHALACAAGFGLGFAMAIIHLDKKICIVPEPFDADDFGDGTDDEMDDVTDDEMDDNDDDELFCTPFPICED